MFDMPIKFFPKDVISGEANKPGDKFTAFFITGERQFEVMADHFTAEFFFATIVKEDE